MSFGNNETKKFVISGWEINTQKKRLSNFEQSFIMNLIICFKPKTNRVYEYCTKPNHKEQLSEPLFLMKH